MRIRFWGTRGSLPKPGPQTLRYGGNTSCVEVRSEDGTLVVLDCGTGAHELGLALATPGGPPLRGHLLIGHTHWDHIQGFPFFAPLFAKGDWDVYAPGGRARQIEAVLGSQMSYDYHPVGLHALDATLRFHDLTEGGIDLGGIRVTCQYLNHPALTLGYRLEADGAVVVYATDHEPHSLHPMNGAAGATPVHHEDRRHVRFLEGADLVIHDAQYLLEEFPHRAGWGHSPVERAVDYALAAHARRLALFHHDPGRDDAELDRLEELARGRAHRASDATPLEVFAAREGQAIPLVQPDRPARSPLAPEQSALLAHRPPHPPSLVLVMADEPLARLLGAALRSEGLEVVEACDGDAALRVARERLPSLIVLDLVLPRRDGLEVCRALRGAAEERLRDVPVLILTGTPLEERDLVEAFHAGATDYLAKPIKPTLLRSRVRGWLLRTPPRSLA